MRFVSGPRTSAASDTTCNPSARSTWSMCVGSPHLGRRAAQRSLAVEEPQGPKDFRLQSHLFPDHARPSESVKQFFRERRARTPILSPIRASLLHSLELQSFHASRNVRAGRLFAMARQALRMVCCILFLFSSTAHGSVIEPFLHSINRTQVVRVRSSA